MVSGSFLFNLEWHSAPETPSLSFTKVYDAVRVTT